MDRKVEDSTTGSLATPKSSPSDKKPLFALVFSGVAFDPIMELGVIHALIQSERKAPDYVLGMSAGSISAAAIGEIFALETKEQKVAKFREFLNIYLGAPSNFLMGMFPQISDADWLAPLEPMQLPIHSKNERDARENASNYLSGTLALLRDFASLPITTRLISRLAYRVLSLSAVENRLSRFKRWWGHLTHMVPFIGLVILNLWRLSPVAWTLLGAKVVRSEAPCPKPVPSFLRVMSAAVLLYVVAVPLSLLWYFFWLIRRTAKVFWLEFKGFCVNRGLAAVTKALNSTWTVNIRRVLRLEPIAKRLKILSLNNSHAALLCNDGISMGIFEKFLHQLLKRYGLHTQILNSYPIEQFVVQLFDPNYYGSREMHDVWERSLLQQGPGPPGAAGATEKTVKSAYGATTTKVVIAATCVATGKALILPETMSVVSSILAAMAYPPFFRAQKVDQTLVIDAASVGEEPTLLSVRVIKEHLNTLPDLDEQSFICLYPVTTYPADKPSRQDSYGGLVDRVQRARDLQRLRRSEMEHQSVRNHTRLLPDDKGVFRFDRRGQNHIFVGADVFPIEADEPLRLTAQLIASSDRNEQERIVLHGVAAGCRATLQKLFAAEISGIASGQEAIKCKRLFEEALNIQLSESAKGGGLPEVCERCIVVTTKGSSSQSLKSLEGDVPKDSTVSEPAWPMEKKGPPATEKSSPETEKSPPKSYQGQIRSPHSKPPSDLKNGVRDKPWVSLLLSGGVFRGVFQIGVICGLNEAGVKPRLIAGSSVGAIIAAMAASINLKNGDIARLHICRTAATFLGLDRLILTDRFADLIRRLTVRAEKADLSLKDFDDIWRRFDKQTHAQFSNKTRRILGGIERLMAISPFELIDLVKEFKNGNDQSAWKLVKDYINYFLDRNEVGLEILGTEPLRLLIQEHVLDKEMNGPTTHFSYFSKHSQNRTCLLATTTDLNNGRLKLIGKDIDTSSGDAYLVEALLASSAFPGVFRSRRSSEVFPQSSETTEYVDGGLMDNLPIEAVVTFLKEEARAGEVDCRPKTPHLLLIAPLETDYQRLKQVPNEQNKTELDKLQKNWIRLSRRAAQLRYNRKITMFSQVEENFQFITEESGLWKAEKHWNPLKIKVQSITPKWLCGTFGFHAMLGFRHDRQAASIAHGCATTLITLAQLDPGIRVNVSNINLDLRMEVLREDPTTTLKEIDPQKLDKLRNSSDSPAQNGCCWFRENSLCPFSMQSLEKMGESARFQSQTRTMLNLIYLQCGTANTHCSPDT